MPVPFGTGVDGFERQLAGAFSTHGTGLSHKQVSELLEMELLRVNDCMQLLDCLASELGLTSGPSIPSLASQAKSPGELARLDYAMYGTHFICPNLFCAATSCILCLIQTDMVHQ